jgi:hypothetical protein
MNALRSGLLGMFLAANAGAAPQGNGIRFDGATAYMADAASLGLTPGSFSVAAWVRATDTNRAQILVTAGESGKEFTLYLYKGAVRMLVEGTPGSYGYATAPLPDAGAWTHYAGTYDGTTVRIYRDGAPAGEKAVPLARTNFPSAVVLGAIDGDAERALKGAMEDVRLWNRALSADDVAAVRDGRTDGAAADRLVARWTSAGVTDNGIRPAVAGGPEAVKRQPGAIALLNRKSDGFRGIWYFNQPLKNEYVYKYSGGLGTYCANHSPFAWHVPEAGRTYFCYGGTDASNSTLLHLVSYYDHKTGRVARPTLLLDKRTDDAHDNPVINVDDRGRIWIFSSSHGRGRPSFISRSVKPHDIEAFECVWTGNFSYPQPMYHPGRGFLFVHTWYVAGRGNYLMSSDPDGTAWSERTQTSYFEEGHYQISGTWKSRKTGIAFNMHPKGKGLNYRTNIYYMESDDFGGTWRTAGGEPLAIPLADKANPALATEYQSRGRNVYLADIVFDAAGRPVILFVLSKGFESGPDNGPREWRIARWTGTEWQDRPTGITSLSNYDVGALYIEGDTDWRLIGPTQPGPQPYNPGGEIAMWTSRDAGATWTMARQMTTNSPMNHGYVRRPVNAHPDFYGFWADGHGRKPSESRLYFCSRDGDVFRLPQVMKEDFEKPERLPR